MRRRHAVALAQLEVGEGGQHADGAVGEVEDAGDRVGEHQAHGRDGVDAAEHQPEERELEELGHAPSLPAPEVGGVHGVHGAGARPVVGDRRRAPSRTRATRSAGRWWRTARRRAPTRRCRRPGSTRLVELVDDQRRQAHRQLVDEQHARVGAEAAGQGEHLLLAARQRAGQLRAPLLEHAGTG